MGYELVPDPRQGQGGEIGLPPEAISPYAEFGHTELIDRFYQTEGDPAIGRELAVRLFQHAGFADDPSATPLIGRDGAHVQEDGRLLMQADYVNFAAGHHFDALEGILDFLMTKPGEEDYETIRAAMVGRLSAGNR